LHGVRERVLREIVRQAQASAERSPDIHVGAAANVRRHDARLYVVQPFATAPVQRVWRLECGVDWQGGRLAARRGPGMNGSLAAVTVAPRHGGERLRLPGQRGSRSVKRLLHDAHVPRWLRVHYPLVYVDEHLAALPGIAVDAAFADDSAHGWELTWEPLEDAL
jgi:tRNA(Ile)-lysidine synthetase-like protein